MNEIYAWMQQSSLFTNNVVCHVSYSREGIITAYKHTSQPIQHKTLTPYMFVTDSSQIASSRLIWNLWNKFRCPIYFKKNLQDA